MNSVTTPESQTLSDTAPARELPLVSRIDQVVTEYARAVTDRLISTEIARRLSALAGPAVARTFYMQQAFQRIRPLVTDYLHSVDGGAARSGPVWCDDPLIYPLLAGVWSLPAPLQLKRSLVRDLKASLRRLLAQRERARRARRSSRTPQADRVAAQPWCIAVEAAEGFDPAKRSDLCWFEASGLDPSRVLVYVRNVIYTALQDQGVPRVLQSLPNVDRLDIRRVDLEQTAFDTRRAQAPVCTPFDVRLNAVRRRDPAERFALDRALWLLDEVDHWRSFVRAEHVKVTFSLGVSDGDGLARRVAMELEGGIDVGAQRSVMSTIHDDTHGRRPWHVYFGWGEARHAFSPYAQDCADQLVTTGFLYDSAFGRRQEELDAIRAQLHEAGATFVVALFDEPISQRPDVYVTREMVLAFYRAFREWLMVTPDIGFVVKSKKPLPVDDDLELRVEITAARQSGRCVFLEDMDGRLPSEASECADLTVGLFIGSAAIEAAARGFRAVHCDLTGLNHHPFYREGHGTLIFDDLDALLAAVQRYKADPSSEPLLGDHSRVIASYDPFRDGKAHARAGEYLRWLLEAFDRGASRKQALQEANARYTAAWGADKVVPLAFPLQAPPAPEERP